MATSKSRFIAVVGGSGSGKSYLAERLKNRLGERAAHLALDDFYRDLSHLPESERDEANFDDPAAIDWDSLKEVLESLERGETASIPVYDFTSHTRKAETRPLEAAPLVVFEGLWLLHPEWLREKFALSVFVDCPTEERLQRRIERDVPERWPNEESVRHQFSTFVQPMHERFVEPQRQWAHRQLSSPMPDEVHLELISQFQAL